MFVLSDDLMRSTARHTADGRPKDALETHRAALVEAARAGGQKGGGSRATQVMRGALRLFQRQPTCAPAL